MEGGGERGVVEGGGKEMKGCWPGNGEARGTKETGMGGGGIFVK